MVSSFQSSEWMAPAVCQLCWGCSGRICIVLAREKFYCLILSYPFLSISIKNKMKVEENRGNSTASPRSRCPYSVIYRPQGCISWKWAVNGQLPICFICWVSLLIVWKLSYFSCWKLGFWTNWYMADFVSAILLALEISHTWFRF